MIPAIVARQVRQSVRDFLLTRYPLTSSRFQNTLKDLLERDGMFQGPYMSLQLPFRHVAAEKDFFPELPLGFCAYLHQEQAFERLGGTHPQPTIVATGTGSGKTEAFLYPILDYCRQLRGRGGIKAIIIYPMNALATDQAKRVANVINSHRCLRGSNGVRAGLYIGGWDIHPSKRMRKDSVITDRYTMQQRPPDILLTNYKMLDYLLVRPRDAGIWQDNRPDTLRFIVVDELHTFDGAQGTDLACLLRRLRDRLKSPDAVPIGTSATLGAHGPGGMHAMHDLQAYAKTVFGKSFDTEGIITEQRLSAASFLRSCDVLHRTVPGGAAAMEAMDPEKHDTRASYISTQYRSWFGKPCTEADTQDDAWRSQLGRSLMHHEAFHNMVHTAEPSSMLCADVAAGLAERPGPHVTLEEQEHQLRSLLALVCHARDPEHPSRPLLDVRIQLWMRELRRMVVSVNETPRMEWADDLSTPQDRAAYLPLVVCRQCGSAGWAAWRRMHDDAISDALRPVYEAFFSRAPELCLLYPKDSSTNVRAKVGESRRLCDKCLLLFPKSTKQCTTCEQNLEADRHLHLVPDLLKVHDGRSKANLVCIYCEAQDSLQIVGAQIPSLASVAIGQLMGSPFNDDKKVLTFSDSVQDASHRAGFFGARTFPFSVRAALVQHLETRNTAEPLPRVAKDFVRALRADRSNEQFVGTFIPPNLCWREDYWDNLVRSGSLPRESELPELVSKRLQWEVYLTFGLNARLGRSLENSLSATAFAEPGLLKAAAEVLLPRLREEDYGLRGLTLLQLQRFLAGLVYRIRTSGGIGHEHLRKVYIPRKGPRYVTSEQYRSFLPRLGPHSPKPAFVTNGRMDGFLPIGTRKTTTWLKHWSAKALYPPNALIVIHDTVYTRVLEELVERKVMDKHKVGRFSVWSLCENALLVTTDVRSFRCDWCRTRFTAPAHERAQWDGMHCLKYNCSQGVLRADSREPAAYYHARYLHSEVRRFVAEEHTGLLSRNRRERVEKSFMGGGAKPWDCNIISCTPTMELGVNIGDLSSVILCGVPPARSNYVQRVGRAGRRDGNALALTVAAARPHDLYYFVAPERMIADSVEVPGTFLRAPEVLKRHLIAFTMDRWVANGAKERDVPDKLLGVFMTFKKENPSRFPYNWLAFADSNASALQKGFLELFESDIGERSKVMVVGFLDGPLRQAVLKPFQLRLKERDELRKRSRRIGTDIKNLDKGPKDRNYETDRQALLANKAMLAKIAGDITDTDVFNFMCDEGLLPNYAFPQHVTKLQSVLLGSDAADRGRKPVTKEYVRPGMMAVRELAPGNTFYAEGRKVVVSRVNLDNAPIAPWRFCDSCAWCSLDAEADQPRCPRCHSSNWTDSGRRYEMARMERVEAVSNARRSLSLDESDDRNRKFYRTRTQVSVDGRFVQASFACTEATVPFGFEFARKVTFREINFGPPRSGDAPHTIAGREFSARGFECCPTCGKVDSRRNGEARHAPGCRSRNDVQLAFRSIFLYHEFESEAIRILVPVVSGQDAATKIESFCAALHMGLKKHFRGRMDHLRTTLQDEPIHNHAERKQFVYLYDTVPGGTGYLKDLLTSRDTILDLLREARDMLAECICQEDVSRDGCYHCLYAYGNRYAHDRISRSAALGLLKLILEKGGALKKSKKLDNIDLNPLVESEAEYKFLVVLKEQVKAIPGGTFKEVSEYGKSCYDITIGDLQWRVHCQVPLGTEEGVALPTRPDFLIVPTEPSKVLPVAVYIDGFAYHLDRLADDTAKRNAIIRSGRYRVWSITWNDLDCPAGSPRHCEDYTSIEAALGAIDDYIRREVGSLDDLENARRNGSMPLLMAVLGKPDATRLTFFALRHALLHVRTGQAPEDVDTPPWPLTEPAEQQLGIVRESKATIDGSHEVITRVRTSPAGIINLNVEELQLAVFIDDALRNEGKFKRAWNGFLFMMNLFQFLPHAGFFSTSGITNESYRCLGLASAHDGSVWSKPTMPSALHPH